MGSSPTGSPAVIEVISMRDGPKSPISRGDGGEE